MKFVYVENYEEMSQKAARYLIQKMKQNRPMTIGFATGGTPIGLYDQLIEDHKQNGTSYENITTFNLDEYIGLEKNHPNSYHTYMQQQLFQHLDIRAEKIHLPNGMADDLTMECERYERSIQEAGGIDLQILGIGENGHIGFNEPGTSFSSTTHIVNLTPSTREANARYFPSMNEVPKQAITMGIKSIMRSKEIILLASGSTKRQAMETLQGGEVTELFPASILNLHPNVIIFVDKQALPSGYVLSGKGAT
ncbi:glucosamine-6-phosphate deaminase [Bacillus kexueae]|uniref:glucosamine-6-phosphate deaminase n=1 Tax=Aeribacillus kexueae TaxID=2078952 RepID=UPI001FAF2D17|nr:glucosamine-6-phosphate deaminase [Bacillus kexueae]